MVSLSFVLLPLCALYVIGERASDEKRARTTAGGQTKLPSSLAVELTDASLLNFITLFLSLS